VTPTFEQLGTGFLFTEGPVWHPAGKFLLWSDMPGDHMRRWSARDGVSTFRKPCNMSNGLTYDRQGRLLACEHASSRVTRTEPDGRITPIATHYKGKQLNSPNDIVCRSDGGIYFSDPPYGRAKFYGVERPQELDFQGVYRVGPDPASTELLVDDFDRPNGLCFSPDEQLLYVVESRGVPNRKILAYDVSADGRTISGKRVLIDAGPGTPDGMRCDVDGNLWCGWGMGSAELDGVMVFAPHGAKIGRIALPERCANVCFGGVKRNRLFMAASQSLYAIYVNTQGAAPG